MDTAVLKSELAALDAHTRRQMIAFLLALDRQSDSAYREKLSRKIDDKNPSHWVRGEDLNAILDLYTADGGIQR